MAMINTTTRAQQPSVSGERKIKREKKIGFFVHKKSTQNENGIST
jgi:hypothetical protein